MDKGVAREPANEPIRRTGATILIVEDNEVVRAVTSRMLERRRYVPIATAGGSESIEVFRAFSQELCCVLLDLSLPGMSGSDLLERIREIDDRVPVVAVSGFTTADIKERLHNQRIEGVVQKPYEVADLVDAIERARRGTESASRWG